MYNVVIAKLGAEQAVCTINRDLWSGDREELLLALTTTVVTSVALTGT